MNVAPYIISSSKFVDLDPRILAVGMASEGFSIKKMNTQPRKNKFYEGKEILFFQDQNGDLKEKYGNTTQDATNEHVLEKYYYGESWHDDGTDTFGYEFDRLYKLGLIPKGLTTAYIDVPEDKNYVPIPGFKGNRYEDYKLGEGPDFVFSDKNRINETATQRFRKSSVYESNDKTRDYTQRIGRQSKHEIEGDWGHTYYKTPKAQVVANAAMWKHATIKLKTIRENLLEKAKQDLKTPHLKEKSQRFIDQLSRPMSKHEEVFWTKVVFNAGQGTQAAAYDMMRSYLRSNFLSDEKYLLTKPTKAYSTIYDNGRHMLDSYKVAQTQNCPTEVKSSGKTKFDTKTTKFLDVKENSKTKASTTSKIIND
jgi:hypothetical protein